MPVVDTTVVMIAVIFWLARPVIEEIDGGAIRGHPLNRMVGEGADRGVRSGRRLNIITAQTEQLDGTIKDAAKKLDYRILRSPPPRICIRRYSDY